MIGRRGVWFVALDKFWMIIQCCFFRVYFSLKISDKVWLIEASTKEKNYWLWNMKWFFALNCIMRWTVVQVSDVAHRPPVLFCHQRIHVYSMCILYKCLWYISHLISHFKILSIDCCFCYWKCDLADVYVDKNRLNQFCEDNSIIGWFETSAKTNKNIGEQS